MKKMHKKKGYKCGGKTKKYKKMAAGGICRGGGAATRGLKFKSRP